MVCCWLHALKLQSSVSFLFWPGGQGLPFFGTLEQPSRDLLPVPQVAEQGPHEFHSPSPERRNTSLQLFYQNLGDSVSRRFSIFYHTWWYQSCVQPLINFKMYNSHGKTYAFFDCCRGRSNWEILEAFKIYPEREWIVWSNFGNKQLNQRASQRIDSFGFHVHGSYTSWYLRHNLTFGNCLWMHIDFWGSNSAGSQC